ncbi:arogenate dehydrogenase 2, chloroplastic-like [Ananas comosus]|uniref:Arogenate dehydrogenase 2, chloroplastic-like n=1 Tax=Ananas comosus TaxID=4615 RepID=A0A6P5GMD1_ANACO|nr:arogenate dehydrogenase 2, chloroplastic-like [Ananas comosus]
MDVVPLCQSDIVGLTAKEFDDNEMEEDLIVNSATPESVGTVVNVDDVHEGQLYKMQADFKRALKAYAMKRGFEYTPTKCNDLKITARCRVADCPWRIKARHLPRFTQWEQVVANEKYTREDGSDRDSADASEKPLLHSRSDHSAAAASVGAAFFRDPHDLCECHPDVVLLATSILSAERVLRSLPLQRLRRSTLFVDVLSVKEFPKNLFLQLLPPHFDILCTHPMFGPESAKDGWAGLPFVYDKVRLADADDRLDRCANFLDIFSREGCRMVEMPCGEHDEIAAESQFLTHTVGRVVAKLDLKPTPINTKGYEMLLKLVENTCSDSFDLYNGLFMYNKNSTELLERLDVAFDSLKKELFGRLHDRLRKQLFESSQSLTGS